MTTTTEHPVTGGRSLSTFAKAAVDSPKRNERRRSAPASVRDDWYFGSLMTWHVMGSDSGGQLTMAETLVRAGGEPPLHVHAREDEAFYVLEGQVLFQRGLERITAGPGQAVLLPRGIPHGFAVQSGVARMMLVFTPAGLEQAFRGVSVPAETHALPPVAGRPADPSVLAESERAFGARGVTFVGPPLPVLLANE